MPVEVTQRYRAINFTTVNTNCCQHRNVKQEPAGNQALVNFRFSFAKETQQCIISLRNFQIHLHGQM